MNSSTNIKYSEIWKIAYPISIGMLAQTLITLIDTAFLGRLGEVELGAASMAGIYYYFFTTLAWGFAVGIQIIIARRYGENKLDRISVVMQHGLLFSILFGVCLFLVISYATELLMQYMLASDDVYKVAIDFIDYRRFGIFFASINFMFRSFYIGISTTKSITYSTILMTIVNVIGDTLLVFGSSFCPALGVKGAALASVMAEFTATVFFICYTLINRPVDVKIFQKFRVESELIFRILRISIPSMFQKFFSIGAWLVFFLTIEKLGERALAVTMLCRSFYMVVCVPIFSFAVAANTLTSRLIGSGNKEMVVPTIQKVIKFSAVCLVPLVLAMIIFPQQCLSVYTDNHELIIDAIPIVYLIPFAGYSMCVGMVYFEAISGTGNTNHALKIEFLVLIIYILYAWFTAIILKESVFIVWIDEVLYGVFMCIFCYWYMHRFNWGNKKI